MFSLQRDLEVKAKNWLGRALNDQAKRPALSQLMFPGRRLVITVQVGVMSGGRGGSGRANLEGNSMGLEENKGSLRNPLEARLGSYHEESP